ARSRHDHRLPEAPPLRSHARAPRATFHRRRGGRTASSAAWAVLGTLIRRSLSASSGRKLEAPLQRGSMASHPDLRTPSRREFLSSAGEDCRSSPARTRYRDRSTPSFPFAPMSRMRPLMRALSVSISLAVLASTASGQDTSSAPWRRETLTSAKLDEQRTILVATPDGYRGSAERYPVLVILDANDRPQFAAAVANVHFLASRNDIPSLIVVGIANCMDRTSALTTAAHGESA